MTTLISLLKGINVSGQKSINMDALRRTYESLGFKHVTTYVQSGNVVFTIPQKESYDPAQEISRQILKDFGFDVSIIILNIDKLEQIINNNPFTKDPGKSLSFLHVTFLSSKPNNYEIKSIEEKKQYGEEIAFSDHAVYLYCPNGYGRSKLNNNFLETKLKVIATTRNWKTTNELLRIAHQIAYK
jgi:uncharacterized protein (DUF1697 family)